jgi:HAMP domain-containing protein
VKRSLSVWINAPLIERLNARARMDARKPSALIEQALAEFLNVPLASRDLPRQPVELCPSCQRGVLNNDRCNECSWHRDPRRSYRPSVRARVQPNQKRPKAEAT